VTASGTATPGQRVPPPRAGFFNAAAIVLVVAAAFPVRLRYSFAVFGSFTVLDVVFVLLSGATAFYLLITGEAPRTGDRKVALLLAVPFIICFLSLAWSDDAPATLRQVGIFSEAIVAYWVAVNVFRQMSTHRLFLYTAAFVALLLLGSVLSLIQVPGFQPPTYGLEEGTREYYTFLTAYYARLGNPFYGLSNDFASVLSLFVLPLLAWGVSSRKALYLIVSAAAFAGLVLTQSRGVIAATLLGGLLFLVVQRRRLRRMLPAVVIGSAMMLGFGYFYYRLNEAVQVYLGDRLQITTIEARREILSAGWRHLGDSPIIGFGAGVVPEGDPLVADGVHNTYLQQMLYYGVPLGLAATGALWLVAIRFLRWPVRPNDISGMIATSVGLSVLVQLAIFLGETSFEATLPKTAFYFFIGLSVAILRTGSSNANVA